MENLEIYNRVRACPQAAQRTIGAGKLKGKTDINPQWRIETLTSLFGPAGLGWYTEIVETWTEKDNGESVAWVKLNLYYKVDGEWSKPVQGVGGSTQFGKGKGTSMDDEAFKMAETDAISVACKKLGLAADIYWEKGSTKYTRAADTQPQQTAPAPQQTAVRKTLTEGGKAWLQAIDRLANAKTDQEKNQTVENLNKFYSIPIEQWYKINNAVEERRAAAQNQ